MTTSGSSRDERRRKIVDRGTDRIALITGRISNLPPSPSSPASLSSTPHRHAFTESSPPTLLSHDHHNPQTILSDQINAGLRAANDVFASTLLKQETTNEVSRGGRFDIGYQVEPQVHHDETSRETIQAPVVDNMTKIQSSPRKSIIQKEPAPPKPLRHQPTFFSSKRLNSCITASQGTRSFCALMIAILVVLSYIDYPLFGVNIVRSESIVASRPLYIVLLTDVTIVLARMYLETRRAPEEAEEERVVHRGEGENWAGAITLLERGLVVYQTIRGVFIDCSVYSVVVICGLSLV